MFIFFPFISLALEDILAKILLCGISEILLPMFAARTFMASQLIFKFFIYFEFILVYGVRWSFSFTFLHVSSTSPNTTYWRDYFYSIVCSCSLCQILIDLGSLLCSTDLCVCSYASTSLFWLQWPCSLVMYQVLWSLQLCSSFSRLLRLFRVFLGSM